jgi:uncharacterized membrane protein YvlD (DUF360 family)
MDILSTIKLDIWVIQTLAMILTAILMPKFTVSGPISALIAVITLSVVNTHLWDAALFFSVPDSITLHAATLIIANGIIFWILVKILPGIDTQGFIAPLLAPIIFTVISVYLHQMSPKIPWDQLLSSAKAIITDTKEHLKNESKTEHDSEQRHSQ